jgi:hypothetical protein
VAGLKEALEVGITNEVDLTEKVDGYFGNDHQNPPARTAPNGRAGASLARPGGKVDEFVFSMNRAAEKAVPGAKDIFCGAIKGMSFEEARKILTGGDTAATECFRAKTSDTLTAAFRTCWERSSESRGRVTHGAVGVGSSRPAAPSRLRATKIRGRGLLE